MSPGFLEKSTAIKRGVSRGLQVLRIEGIRIHAQRMLEDNPSACSQLSCVYFKALVRIILSAPALDQQSDPHGANEKFQGFR